MTVVTSQHKFRSLITPERLATSVIPLGDFTLDSQFQFEVFQFGNVSNNPPPKLFFFSIIISKETRSFGALRIGCP